VLVPGAAAEADGLVRDTYANDRITYLRTQIVANREARPVELGRLLVERHGSRATVIAVGPMLDRTLAATADMDVTVLYATTLNPFDADTLSRELAGDDVVVVEPFFAGTLAGPVSEALRDRPTRLHFVGVPRVVIRDYGTPQQLDHVLGLDAAGIHRRIASAIS
jgi:transketolase